MTNGIGRGDEEKNTAVPSSETADELRLPWRVRASKVSQDFYVMLNASERIIANSYSRESLEYACRAVNAHNALVTALKTVELIFNNGLDRTSGAVWDETAGKVYAALALAEGNAPERDAETSAKR